MNYLDKAKAFFDSAESNHSRHVRSESFSSLELAQPVLHEHSSELVREKHKHASRINRFLSDGKWKTSILATWNNIKHSIPLSYHRFHKDRPIWLLGKMYFAESEVRDIVEALEDGTQDVAFQDFIADFGSRIWLTYRRSFQPFADSNVETDCGWGCMLRSAQMLLAQTYIILMLDRDWTMFAPQSWELLRKHRQVVSCFGDIDSAPFSLHQLVQAGRAHGKQPGDWFGPTTTALVLKSVVESTEENPLTDLAVYVAQDCSILLADIAGLCCDYRDSLETQSSPGKKISEDKNSACKESTTVSSEFVQAFNRWNSKIDEQKLRGNVIDSGKILEVPEKNCMIDVNLTSPECETSRGSNNFNNTPVGVEYSSSSTRYATMLRKSWKRPLLILIPLRLGAESMNSLYIPVLKNILSMRTCVGIIGGKPKHSLYFIGWHGECLIYLDPHYCQDFVDTTKSDFSIRSFHCLMPKLVAFADMDPSCTVGFLVRNSAEFEQFLAESDSLLRIRSPKGRLYPLFSFLERREEITNLDRKTPNILRDDAISAAKDYEIL